MTCIRAQLKSLTHGYSMHALSHERYTNASSYDKGMTPSLMNYYSIEDSAYLFYLAHCLHNTLTDPLFQILMGLLPTNCRGILPVISKMLMHSCIGVQAWIGVAG